MKLSESLRRAAENPNIVISKGHYLQVSEESDTPFVCALGAAYGELLPDGLRHEVKHIKKLQENDQAYSDLTGLFYSDESDEGVGETLNAEFPILLKKIKLPTPSVILGSNSIHDVVTVLNDNYGFSLSEIADWIETVENFQGEL